MNLSTTILRAVQSTTKKWTKQRKAEERAASRRERRLYVFNRAHRDSQRDVAFDLMEEAYLKASSNGALPAGARQIMYVARGPIQDATGKPLNDDYFTQTLLPDYLRENPESTANWDVVFDARGHLEEPHTEVDIPLGTLQVRGYLRDMDALDPSKQTFWPFESEPARILTAGPENRFGAILFVEKEGFMPLFRATQLAERFDIAIMSTKGMSVVAARQLVDRLCSGQAGVPLLVVHDFDKAGFSIATTLRQDTRRYEFANTVNVIDLGLRLEDVDAYGLQSEVVYYGKSNPRHNLAQNGATEAEMAFLHDAEASSDYTGHHGHRVELNAFTSAALIEWLEEKLKKHGVKKLIPEKGALDMAYRHHLTRHLIEEAIKRERRSLELVVKRHKAPRGLAERVRARLVESPEIPWDQAVALEIKDMFASQPQANRKKK